MCLRLPVVLLGLLLCACTTAADKKAAIDAMERRHTEEMQRMGSGGSM